MREKRKSAQDAEQAPAPRRRGRPLALETRLPETYVMARWGCSARHARRVIANGDAACPPWEIVDCMLRAALLVADGHDPAEIVEGFRESILDWLAGDAEDAGDAGETA